MIPVTSLVDAGAHLMVVAHFVFPGLCFGRRCFALGEPSMSRRVSVVVTCFDSAVLESPMLLPPLTPKALRAR